MKQEFNFHCFHYDHEFMLQPFWQTSRISINHNHYCILQGVLLFTLRTEWVVGLVLVNIWCSELLNKQCVSSRFHITDMNIRVRSGCRDMPKYDLSDGSAYRFYGPLQARMSHSSWVGKAELNWKLRFNGTSRARSFSTAITLERFVLSINILNALNYNMF